MTTYRAAYLAYPQSAGVVLTGPEHAGLSDDALRAEALAEALRADIVCDHEGDDSRTSRAEFDRLLCIGEWCDGQG